MVDPEKHSVHADRVEVSIGMGGAINFQDSVDGLSVNITYPTPVKYGFYDAFWIMCGATCGLLAVVAVAEIIVKVTS